MAPERIENLIAVPIERKIRELAEVKDIRTLASEGSLTIYVDLNDEVGNVNATWQRLRDKIGDVKVELPDGVVGPFVNSDFGDVAIATIAITGEGFSPRELKDVADDFRKKLYQMTGISKIDLFGFQDERVWLELDTRKLAAVGVQLNALIKDLQAQNVVLPSGNINARRHAPAAGDIRRLSECACHRNHADPGRDDRQPRAARRSRHRSPRLRLAQDQADLLQRAPCSRAERRSCSPIRTSLSSAKSFARRRATTRHSSRSDTRSISRLTRRNRSAPPSTLRCQTWRRPSSSWPRWSLLFLGLRAGSVAAMIVPFAVMFSLIGMRALGIALEQVSIAAIIIALGLLVDNGVVIVEDIVSRIGRGMPAQDAGPCLRRAICPSAADILGHHGRGFSAAVSAVGSVGRICASRSPRWSP